MNREINNHIKRDDLQNYIGKEITIVTHTKVRQEGLEVAWYNKPKKVKLLEYIDSENLIKVVLKNKIYEIKLNTLDEIIA